MAPPLPPSLFGRLILLLSVLLAAAQLISAAAHFYDSNQLTAHAAGVNSAERIAGIVRLLEPMAAEERRRAAQALDVPPLHVALGGARLPAGHPDETAAAALLHLIQDRLGEGYTVAVQVQALAHGTAPELDVPLPALGHRHTAADAAQSSYRVEVRLRDGQEVVFDYHLPANLFAWRWRLVASLAVLLVSALFIAWLAVRSLTRPLARLARAADELGRDIEHPPLSEDGPLEVAAAARAFNRMQERLRRFISDRSRVLAAVSHDLKTPITRLRLRAALLDDEALQEKVQADLDEMEAMVNDSLEFLRGLEGREPVRPIDLEALLESLQGDAEEMGRPLTLHGHSDAPYPGRPLALKRCIDNLVQNAFRYGSRAAVRLDDSPEQLRIVVEDDGPGIPPELHARVFEPFFRIEGSRSRETGGSGLGLAIARNIARAHGGDVTLANRPQGGLAVTIALPR